MNALLQTYRARIKKLEESSSSSVVPAKKQKKEPASLLRAVDAMRDKFRAALSEADDRAAELERANRALQIKLDESEERARQLQLQPAMHPSSPPR